MFWREHSYVAYSTTYAGYLTLCRKSAFWRRKKISCCMSSPFTPEEIYWIVILGYSVMRFNVKFPGKKRKYSPRLPKNFIIPDFLSFCVLMFFEIQSLVFHSIGLHAVGMDWPAGLCFAVILGGENTSFLFDCPTISVMCEFPGIMSIWFSSAMIYPAYRVEWLSHVLIQTKISLI